MNVWQTISDFFASGQRRRGVRVSVNADEIIRVHRPEPPERTAIILTKNETGVTFDFPVCDPIRTIESDQAWRMFHLGLFLAIASVFPCLVIPRMGGNFLQLPVGIAMILLAIGVFLKSRAIVEKIENDASRVRQLSVAGNLVVRRSRDEQKKVWFRHEIRDIVLVKTPCKGGLSNASRPTYNLRLEAMLHNGEIVILDSCNSVSLNDAPGPREELEWIATHLRLALFPALPPTFADPHAHAIQAKDSPRGETRYTE